MDFNRYGEIFMFGDHRLGDAINQQLPTTGEGYNLDASRQ